MNATKILFTLELLLATIGVDAVQTKQETIEDYFDQVMTAFYPIIELAVPDNESVTMENVEIFLDNSTTPTTLETFALGKFSGLGTQFHRQKQCYVSSKKRGFTVTCTIEFGNLQATLPAIDTDVTYVLLINATVRVYLSWPKDSRPVTVKLITLSNVTFAMNTIQLKHRAPAYTSSTYSLDEISSTNFRKKYRTCVSTIHHKRYSSKVPWKLLSNLLEKPVFLE
uniref:Putative secreted protein n=1 Tax=Ixodes ricinus TaxID=34613 RepID=A0A090XD25_IXORI